METYCMYLRKSRADAEAELRGEGETLARHRRTLLELAKRRGIELTAEYCEIVSGDSIAARPQMQALLADIETKKYTGVLCMEIERLARGNTIDQGIVAQAFKDSGTLIITPVKTYDPNNEFDEEYFEFSLFMSRREYKTIKRRMQAGRLASVKEGNYIGTTAPYGYRKTHPEPKVHTLEIIPEEAEHVHLMYRMYMDGNGPRAIASELNARGVVPVKTAMWEPVSVKKILQNPIYKGMVQWRTKGSGESCYKGMHPAIIPPDVFDAVQDKRRANPAAQVPDQKDVKNHYHNVLFCANCGHQMRRRYIKQSGKAHMLCRYKTCTGKVVSATMDSVDDAVLSALHFRVGELETLLAAGDTKGAVVKDRNSEEKRRYVQELQRVKKQQTRLYDLLEQEVYDTPTFLERMQVLNAARAELERRIADIEREEVAPKRSVEESIVHLKHVIERFPSANADEKNRLLLLVVKKIWYKKTEKACFRKPNTDLELELEFL